MVRAERSERVSVWAWWMLVCVVLALAAGSTGCMRLNTFEVSHLATTATGFEGVKQIFEGAGDKTGRDLNIVFIHGIGWYSGSDPEPYIEDIEHRLGLKEIGDEVKVPVYRIVADGDSDRCVIGSVTTREFQNDDGHRVWTRKVDWRPAVEQKAKDGLRRENCKVGHRLKTHHRLKSEEINHRIADTALYLNPSVGEDVRSVLRAAIQQIDVRTLEAESIGKRGRGVATVVISHSLGSRVLFDVMAEQADSQPEAFIEGSYQAKLAQEITDFRDGGARTPFLNSVERVFMMANQLSMLGLALNDPDDTNASLLPDEWKSSDPTQFRYVIVSDPNDFLSFRLEDDLRRYDNGNGFIEFEISLARRAWYIPLFNLGFVASPATAHVGFSESERVRELVVEGHTIEEKSR